MLRITWKDGRVSELPFTLLRRECPCAECKDKREKRRQEAEGKENAGKSGALSGAPGGGLTIVSNAVARGAEGEVLEVYPVGHYALGITFGDGHEHGIFSYRLLRGLAEPGEG